MILFLAPPSAHARPAHLDRGADEVQARQVPSPPQRVIHRGFESPEGQALRRDVHFPGLGESHRRATRRGLVHPAFSVAIRPRASVAGCVRVGGAGGRQPAPHGANDLLRKVSPDLVDL